MVKGMQVAAVAALLAIALSAMGIVGSMDEQDRKNQASLYCEMRDIYKQTKGEYGWPSFDKAAEGECK